MDNDCEDQALCATRHCVKFSCHRGFDDRGQSVYAPLVKRGRDWCCENCGASYGTNPHPDLR